MILIIGGFGEDRNGYAKEQFPGYELLPDYQETVKAQLLDGKEPQAEVRKYLAAEEAHEEMRHMPQRFGDGETGAARGNYNNTVITTVEMGCGVVPMDAFERRYREENGRVNCILAERADEVIRVLCGIGIRIK